jgi:nicotinate-nucleotide adenylyltransferase
MKIGICGGTFDPFHRGHLDPIVAVRERMQWDRVLYIPAYIQPFKQDRETVSGYHRFAMTVLGIEDHPDFYASPQELERGSVSYTIDTLHQLRIRYPGATLDWIIGDDNLEKLDEWRSIETIVKLANFVVLTRAGGAAGCSPPDIANLHLVFAENATVPVSSTEVRRRLRAGEPIDDLVPPRVSRYIQRYELYRKGQS